MEAWPYPEADRAIDTRDVPSRGTTPASVNYDNSRHVNVSGGQGVAINQAEHSTVRVQFNPIDSSLRALVIADLDAALAQIPQGQSPDLCTALQEVRTEATSPNASKESIKQKLMLAVAPAAATGLLTVLGDLINKLA